jgi:hypothetical protein
MAEPLPRRACSSPTTELEVIRAREPHEPSDT